MSAEPPSTALRDALKAMLRPLVRLLIARGLTLPNVTAALKETFVDVAGRDFRLGGRAPSDSRVSLLTGVHRKDIRAIREDAHPLSAPREGGLGATVVGRWLGDAAYLDAEGRPLQLSRQAPSGVASFDGLVASVSKDVRPRTVLDELVRLGVAAWDEDGDRVRLLADAFVPAGGDDDMLRFLQRNIHDHLAAASANLLAGPSDRRYLERAVFYNNLRPADVDRLEEEARTLALAALRHLNGQALEMQRAAQGDPVATERFRFGVYFYREPVAGEGDEPATAKPPESA